MTEWKNLEFEERSQEGVIVFRLRGVLTSSPPCYVLLERLRDQVHQGCHRIAIDMENVTTLTSAGVGILAACYSSVARSGGRITLFRVPQRIQTILKVVHLYEMIGDCASEEEAIAKVRLD